MFCKVYKKDRVIERFPFSLLWEGKCGIDVKDNNETRVMPMVTVKGLIQESWLGLELLLWAVVQKE